jgi:peptidyl-prolyl cis-trans isomerase D
MAKALGLKPPSDDELLSELQRQPVFQANGTFSRSQYRAFERNVLSQLGATTAQFENKLREDIILTKLQATAAAAAWISPMETQRLVARYGDSFQIQYVTLNSNLVSQSEVKVTAEDLQAFYASHTNLFEVPSKTAVRYVEFPISNHLSKASVTADAVEEYYDTHTDRFTETGTNGTKVITPIDAVRDSVSNLLIHETATQVARDLATDFVVALTPARDGAASPFESVAGEFGVGVKTSGLFAAEGPVAGIDAGQDWIAAAFKLRPTPEDYFSDAITGTGSVYVLALATNTEAYVPAFEEVRSKVEPLARAKAAQDALIRKGESVRRTFQEGLAQKESFAALAKQQALNIHTTAFFSAFSAPEALNSGEILEEIVLLNRGDLSTLLASTNGYTIAYVVDRKPASEDDAQVVRTQLGANVMRRRARILFSEWQESLVQTGRKTKTVAVPDLQDED